MIGRILSHYRVTARLGAGGMGEVYLALDLELGREVALKILPAGFTGNPERIERFRREAKAIAALNHPNIVTVHSIEMDGELPFMTMERVAGESLDRRVAPGGLSIEELLSLANQLADALAAAHAKGIVHRDLKPANLMVTAEGRLKVLDFGLAKLAPRNVATAATIPEDAVTALSDLSALTERGAVLGTAAYMSPEQAQGQPVDGRSDLFSCGVVLYELATGKRPFGGDNLIAVASSVLRDRPPAVAVLRPQLPEELSRLIERCLEKRPQDRIQSASEIAEAVRALREAGSRREPRSAARELRTSAAVRTPWPRAAIALAAAAALALAVLWIARSRGPGPESPTAVEAAGIAGAPKRLAVLPFESVGGADRGYFADGVTDEVRSKLAALSGFAVIARATADSYRGSTKPPDVIARELGVKYLLTARVRFQETTGGTRIRVTPELVEVGKRGAPMSRWQETLDAELKDVFSVQSAIASRVAQALEVALSGAERSRVEAAPTSNLVAYDLYLQARSLVGDFKQESLRRAIEDLEKAVALDPEFAEAWAELATFHTVAHRILPTRESAEAARIAVDRARTLAPNLPDAALAEASFKRRVEFDLAGAESALARGLRVAPNHSGLLEGAARLAIYRGRLDEAEKFNGRALELDMKSQESLYMAIEIELYRRRSHAARMGADRCLALIPRPAICLHQKAMSFVQEGDFAAARALFAAPPEPFERSEILGSFFASPSARHLGWVPDAAGQELVLRLPTPAFGGDDVNWGLGLASIAHQRGELAARSRYATAARRLLEKNLTQLPDEAELLAPLGLACSYLDDRAAADAAGERALALRPIAEDAYNGPFLVHTRVLGQVLLGENDSALDRLEILLATPYYLTPAWLRVDPQFDPLRADPRFERLAGGG